MSFRKTVEQKTYRSTHRGMFFFPTQALALKYAQAIGAPTDRILPFYYENLDKGLRGYAIQWHKSGPYVGPKTLEHPPGSCQFCPAVSSD